MSGSPLIRYMQVIDTTAIEAVAALVLKCVAVVVDWDGLPLVSAGPLGARVLREDAALL